MAQNILQSETNNPAIEPVVEHCSELRDRLMPYTDTLGIYRGAGGQFTLYEEDGTSHDYLRGRGSRTRITRRDAERRLTLQPAAPRGATNVIGARRFRVVVPPDGATRDVRHAGSRLTAAF